MVFDVRQFMVTPLHFVASERISNHGVIMVYFVPPHLRSSCRKVKEDEKVDLSTVSDDWKWLDAIWVKNLDDRRDQWTAIQHAQHLSC